MKNYLGVEIGGSKQQIYIFDESIHLLEIVSEKISHPNGAADILAWLEENVQKVLKRYPDVACIGVGFGGPLESATGRILCSVHVPGWKDFELKTWFEEKFQKPAVIVNDTVAGGFAELKLGSGRDSSVFFYTNIGTGIGGSIFIHGEYFDGIGYGGAYLGNTYVADWTSDQPGAICRLECVSSGINIEARLRKPGYVPSDSSLLSMCGGDIQKIDGRMLKEAAVSGDAFAMAEIERVATSYGNAIGNMVTLLGCDVVAIGGGIANYGEFFRKMVEKAANDVVFISGKDRFRLVLCELMDDNVPYGAALFAREAVS